MKLETIKNMKLQEMQLKGIDSKYMAELARKKLAF
jgi:hypothetical protein